MSVAAMLELADHNALRTSTRDRSPYPWIAIPPGGVSFFAKGSAPAPAYGVGNQIILCEYKIPIAFEGVLTDVMNEYTDAMATFVEGSGDIVWDYDVNRPLAAPLSTGRYLNDYFNVTTKLGDLQQPWPVRGGIRLKQGDTIRLKVYTVNTVSVGSPAFMHGSLLGWIWPMAHKG